MTVNVQTRRVDSNATRQSLAPCSLGVCAVAVVLVSHYGVNQTNVGAKEARGHFLKRRTGWKMSRRGSDGISAAHRKKGEKEVYFFLILSRTDSANETSRDFLPRFGTNAFQVCKKKHNKKTMHHVLEYTDFRCQWVGVRSLSITHTARSGCRHMISVSVEKSTVSAGCCRAFGS